MTSETRSVASLHCETSEYRGGRLDDDSCVSKRERGNPDRGTVFMTHQKSIGYILTRVGKPDRSPRNGVEAGANFPTGRDQAGSAAARRSSVQVPSRSSSELSAEHPKRSGDITFHARGSPLPPHTGGRSSIQAKTNNARWTRTARELFQGGDR